MENMITQLQTIVQHQANELSNLSQELYAQQKELASLKQQLSELRILVDETSSAADGSIEPPPPHY